MALKGIDWFIVVAAFALMLYGAVFSRRYMKSVSDFLAAGRSAGRYLISIALGMAMLGSITVVGEFQVYFNSGFCLKWWELSNALVILLVTVSGWVIYRFRQTRALTLAQFFEQRYSRRFRIFAGVLAFVSGIINFGIFPAVSARFFIYYCGIPTHIQLLGLQVSTFSLAMGLLLAVTLFFVFSGGQVSVIITDFIQGVFSNVVFMVLILFVLSRINWTQIFQALSSAPANASLINPFHTSDIEHFNFRYFLIGMIGIIYNTMAWQGTQAYNASARSAHEAKMAQVLGNWRNYPRNLFLMFLPVIAITILRHPDFSVLAAKVNGVLSSVGNAEIRSQLQTPMVLRHFLPPGLIGAFAAMMLAAFIGCHQSYLHSWGSIFIQDVVMPIRKKPFAPRQHIRLLRLSILGVAVFIFLFSLLFHQSQHIYLFFAITAAIFVGGSGAVLIGGLYWRLGSTAAAWSAMITGSLISVAGIVLNQVYKKFPINGQEFWGIAMFGASLVYVLVSLLGKRRKFDLDQLLHRGRYAIVGEMKVIDEVPARGWKMLGMGREFTAGDRFIYILSYAWIFIWTVLFIAGTVANLVGAVSDRTWMTYWKYYVMIFLSVSLVVVTWFSIGGFIDMKRMFRQLAGMKRDDSDDGFIARK